MQDAARIGRSEKLRVEKLRSGTLVLSMLSAVFIAIGLYLVVTGAQLVDELTSAIGLTIGFFVLVFAIVFFLWPIFTPNLLTPTKLVVRFGCLFNMSIPLSNIERAERISRGGPMSSAGPIGTRYSAIDRRYSVLRSGRGAVLITLKN
ncbi:MAG: hypothetical protein QW505_02640, partial [Thermoplasmata archaeon]